MKAVPEYYPDEQIHVDDEEEDELESPPRSGRRAAPTKASVSVTSKTAPTRPVRAKGKGRAKVVESDGDSGEDFGAALAAIPDVPDSDSDLDDSTIKSSAPTRSLAPRRQTSTRVAGKRATSVSSTRRSASRAPSVAPSQRTTRGTQKRSRGDSDSDDDVAFKGFGSKRTRR